MTHSVAVELRRTIEQYAPRPATRIKDGDGWRIQTYEELGRSVNQVAQGLLDRGIEVGDRIGIFMANCPQWTWIDFGALTVRAVPVPLYATSTPDQIRHIVSDAGVRVMFVGNRSECERVLKIADELPSLEQVVILNPYEGMPSQVLAFADFLTDPDPEAVDSRLEGADPGELFSIIYTSGTTGEPKGVMLTHAGMMAQREAVLSLFDMKPEDHSLAFLPLSHAFERGWSFVVLTSGAMNTYVPDARQVAELMVEAEPTLMVSVPRLYEKVFATAHQKVAGSKLKRGIFRWALRVGGRNQRAHRKGRRPGLWWQAQLPLAERLVFKGVRRAMGGSKTVLACGGAPLRIEVEEFFSAVGMPLMCGYGLTEASPLVSFNSPQGFKLGTAGRVMGGGELAIGEGGEVLYRGPNVMAGYWNNPEATAETIKDGWLHTGDIGYVDTDGFLVITDRLKDIIVTQGGKNVAPQPIEGMILADPLFEHAVLLGDNRPFVTLLVRPSLPQVEELGKALQWPGNVAEWLKSNDLLEELRRRVKEMTASLPSQERPRETAVMDDELTMDNGLLTPTLKVRRRQVEERFRTLVDEMYNRLAQNKGKE